MKNKSARHKEVNTFKFQPFADRISNIDVDIFHKVAHEYEAEAEDESYFYQSIQKWSVLNLTEAFAAFRKEIRADNYITLPQVVLSKDQIVAVLEKHIQLKDPLTLQPLLEVLVAFAKDLRKDFYDYYHQFFQVLIDLLNTKDTDQLEWVFTCLAHIFKFLWRSLVKDINNVFKALLPLLSDSKPEYINKFAAESFAFVARKVNDRPAFLALLLKAVKSHPDGIGGCGKLLFEVIHGIEGQFHSYADTLFPFLVDSLSNDQLPQNVLFEILEQVVVNVVLHINPRKSGLFYSTLIGSADKLLDSWRTQRDEKVFNALEQILKLLGQSIEYKSGKLLQEPVSVVQLLVKLLSEPGVPDNIILNICNISILLLLSQNIRLSQEHASLLIRKTLSIPQKTIFLHFIDNIHQYGSFEGLILPSFLKYCIQTDLNDECLHILTKLVLKKAPLCGSGINLCQWSKYSLNFGSESNRKLFNILLNKIGDTGNVDEYFCALVCLPHLNSCDVDRVTEILDRNLNEFQDKLNKITDIKSDRSETVKILFLLHNTLQCVVHLSNLRVLSCKFAPLRDCLLRFSGHQSFILSLRSLSLLLTALKEEEGIATMLTLTRIHEKIQSNFSSPFHEVRQLTCHIYTIFEELPEFKLQHSTDPEVVPEAWQVFSLCFRVESIEPHVHTYRDQLQQLEKLHFEKPQMRMCLQTEFQTIPLRYLCGALFMNFKLLWEPLTKLIASHANGLEISLFWDVFLEELQNVTDKINCPEEDSCAGISSDCDFIRELFTEWQRFNVKPDYFNHRLLLWRAMGMFPQVAEAKTKDTAEFLLNFVNFEYINTDSGMGVLCNIKENTDSEVAETVETEAVKKPWLKPLSNRKAKLRILLEMLNVFSKYRSPLSMHREPELNKLYFDLLQHKDTEMRKAALDCISTYKHKFLMPYKESLYNLLDEQKFKNEITSFRIDRDSATVKEEHRAQLIPYILQIVFSQLKTKTGAMSVHTRRNLVLRFLAGCENKEMMSFVQMAFKFYSRYLNDNCEQMVGNICTTTDLTKFLLPKRLQSSLNLLTIVVEEFGGLMDNALLSYLLQINLIVGAMVKTALDKGSAVHSGYLSILRNIRTSSINITERLFAQFDRFPWTSKQINAIFIVFVWPYLDKLHIECVHSPTPLLRVFLQWGTNPRYFPLLLKQNPSNTEQYVLLHIIKLLSNERCNNSVESAVYEILEKLLSLQPDEEDLQLVIPVDDLRPVEKTILDRVQLNEKLNYGSCILLPHTIPILENIKRKLLLKSKSIPKKEVFILSRISELVWEADICDQVVQLLIPLFLKRYSSSTSEESLIQCLTSVKNLLQNVANPVKHLRLFTPTFGEVNNAAGRKLLTAIVEQIAESSDELKLASNMVTELNAWDAKWLEQPDYERRHNAFKQIQALDEINLELGVLLIYNCYYFLKNEKDLSLRENSSHTLRLICVKLLRKFNHHKDVDYILNETIFSMIRKGMKSKSDDFRNECILLLGYLARECPESHFILRDLNLLTNKVDMEVDFFENLTHLQLHRHNRALLKFSQVAKEQGFNKRTLTQFVLPLASHYLCNEKYSNKNSVVDAAIEAVATVCRILPWHQYESVLKFYLSQLRCKLDFQKQLVRVVVVILDAFHFDLSKGYVEASTVNHVVEEKENAQPEADKSEVMEEEFEEEKSLEEIDDAEETEEPEEEVKTFDKITVLCKSTATRVIQTIQNALLPQLNKSLAFMTQYESSHKVNRKRTGHEREEEDLLRVPISLALVKLLQRLPQSILKSNLPGIFMKLCTFLRSKLDSVRRAARETLQKIMLTLGPKFLPLLLREITPLLNKGFQVHVLVYTAHSVLNCLKEMYEPGDIDKVLLTVLDLCKADLFGSLSEEKEVAKILVKVSEAKSTKSFDTFQILAQFITEKCLLDLLLPIKQVLETSHSFKIVQKAQECLRFVSIGLVENNFVQVESLLKFAYGTSSESIPELLPVEKKKLSRKERDLLQREKPDSLIIQPMPKSRASYRQKNVKSSTATNAHMLVEFGLRLCLTLLKKEKIKDVAYRPFIDPFVGVFTKCLNSKHVKLSALTLQCLSWVMKFELPSLKHNIKEIAKKMFSILHTYGSAGLSKGDNFDLVVAAFKAMTVLVRDVKYYKIEVSQLKVLLLYVEQDMHDHDRQATAFNLLRAIIARKLVIPEIHDVMGKVAELSIISELDHVRVQARIVFYQFLMEYPLGILLEKHLTFYLSQLAYEMQFGRESAIEMISTLVGSFPMKVLKQHCSLLWITLGARLVNDEEPECRKKIADCLVSMLGRLEEKERNDMFDIIVSWLRDKNISHRRLAAQLCGFLVQVEKASFKSRLKVLNPLLLKQFGLDNNQGRFVKLHREKEEKDTEEHQRVKDHHLFQVYQLLLKISAQCPSFLKEKELITDLAIHTQTLLGYPHDWVRLGAVQFLGFVFSNVDVERLGELLIANETDESGGYLFSDPRYSVKSLTLDLCDQLQPGDNTNADLAEQVIKNLVFIARVLQHVPFNEKEKSVNLLWLAKRMRKIVNTEIVEGVNSTVLRKEVFKWIAAVGTVLDVDIVIKVLPHILAPLVREMLTTDEKNAQLRQLGKEVAKLLKQKVGFDVYTDTLSKLQQNLSVKRAERKRTRTQLAVTDPEMFAKKKIKRNEKKRELKKRKISALKGEKRVFKRRKLVDLGDNSEVM